MVLKYREGYLEIPGFGGGSGSHLSRFMSDVDALCINCSRPHSLSILVPEKPRVHFAIEYDLRDSLGS